MEESLITYGIAALIVGISVYLYVRNLRETERRAKEATERGELYSSGPQAQHPRIDTEQCIGCQSCTLVCPEGDVLGMLGGKAVIIAGHKCIGHSLCAEACPVGAITMVMAHPGMSADRPVLTPEYETSLPNLFIVGELGGLALIKNAVNQGRDCVDTVHARLAHQTPVNGDVHDLLIVGAGPAGISASLRAIQHRLRYVTLEQDEVGGTVAKYPRQKLVMTSPVEFPIYGKFNKTELTKEVLLSFWHKVSDGADVKINTGRKVAHLEREADGHYTVTAQHGSEVETYRSRAVILALGKSGTPRKLGVKGEELPKVMYRLIEADHYTNKRILVIGGGDSAVEAAMGLASQRGNRVTLSYRQESFNRIKDRNAKRLDEKIRSGALEVILSSTPTEILPDAVVLDVRGESRTIENDYVWIFAGGTPPTEFLKKIGVSFGTRDITLEASLEARGAVAR